MFLIINIKLNLTVIAARTDIPEGDICISHILSLSTEGIRRTESPASLQQGLLPASDPGQHSPYGTVQIQSHHTFFFLNIVKSNTSPSCTHWNCQTMFGIIPSLVLLVDGSEQRKTKNIKGFLLKCKRLSTFSFISHFRTIDRLHFCLYMSKRTLIRSSGISKKRAHCQQITFSFWPKLGWEEPAANLLWYQKLSVWVNAERRSWKRSSGGTLGPHIICQEVPPSYTN